MTKNAMSKMLDTVFNVYTFVILNTMIIIAAEFAGGGTFFYDSGLIHIIAILFVGLAILRIFLHYYAYDPIFEKFIKAVAVAFIIFGLSHVVEFVSYVVLKLPYDVTFANVANFYAISLSIMAFGAERFLRVSEQRSALLIQIFRFVIGIFVLFTFLLFFDSSLISLEINSMWPYSYIAILGAVGAIAFIKVSKIGKLVTISGTFSRYLLSSIVLIIIAALVNVLYDVLKDTLSVTDIQGVYVSHFAFYIALSLMFLSFKAFAHIGGVYEDLQNTATIM